MEEKKIARENRNEEKLSHGDWVMAEFYATWCPHCKRMHPVVKQFKKMMEGILGSRGGGRGSGKCSCRILYD